MKEAIIACSINDYADFIDSNYFTSAWEYDIAEFQNIHPREMGKFQFPGYKLRMFVFDPQGGFFDLKCAWNPSEKINIDECDLVHERTKVMIVNWIDERQADYVVRVLMQWIINQPCSTFPPKFKIWSGVHMGRDAVFAKINPETN